MEQHYQISELLDRVFNGTATDEERLLVRDWLYQLDVGDQIAEALEDLTPLKMTMLKQILEKKYTDAEKNKHEKVVQGKFVTRLLRVAAIFIGVLIVAGYLSTYQNNNKSKKIQTIVANNDFVTITSDTAVRYLILPDKSRVWLNSHSQLQYSLTQFNDSDRKLQLSGEAYFEVHHDTSKPFIVQSGEIATHVTGTGFNISSYQNDDRIKVTLVHGSVVISGGPDNTLTRLSPRQQLQYEKKNKGRIVSASLSNPAENWMNGALSFINVRLEDALDDIGHRYNMHIIYDQKLTGNKRITAWYGHSKSLDFVLKKLLYVHGLNYRIEKGAIHIYKN